MGAGWSPQASGRGLLVLENWVRTPQGQCGSGRQGHHQLSPGCPVTSWEGNGCSLHVGVILSKLGDLCRVSSLGPAYRLRGLWRPHEEGQRGSWDVGARPLALKSSSWEQPFPAPSCLLTWFLGLRPNWLVSPAHNKIVITAISELVLRVWVPPPP